MKLQLKQINKDLFSATFEIIENEKTIGNISLEGHFGSMETTLNGKIYDHHFFLKYNVSSKEKFRMYDILENNIRVGEVYQTIFKNNIFSKYEYIKCVYENSEYCSYSIGLENKAVNCIYLGNKQVAQIEKDGTVYNDLHEFVIYAKDKQNLLIGLIVSCYMYINTCYKPGIKTKQSVVKNYSKTTNKNLLTKYNPNWIDTLKEENNEK